MYDRLALGILDSIPYLLTAPSKRIWIDYDDEAAEFWDEYSFLDYDDAQEIHFSVDLRKNRNYVDLLRDLTRN